MMNHTDEPYPPATLPADNPGPRQSIALMGSTRHDGWTGEKMAIFCETLAETAVVAEACDAACMGVSGAYACRRRNPVFAAAWDAALTIARERLADTLLARSMEGNVEQIWRDGQVVGERHVLDNRLGLAILRRLDRLADTGLSTSTRGERAPNAPAPRSKPLDWELMTNALRTGNEEAIRDALAMLKGDKVEEIEGSPNPLIKVDARGSSPNSLSHCDDEPEELDLSGRCWVDPDSDGRIWMTDFPPPEGFTGHQSCEWGDPDTSYSRECTPEEVAILEADIASARAAQRAEEEKLRDEWFALLKAENDPPLSPPSQGGERGGCERQRERQTVTPRAERGAAA